MIDFAHPLSITLISAAGTALIWFAVPSLALLFDRARTIVATIARSWMRSALIVFLFSVATSAVPSLIYGIPLPYVHDEFAYLLQGETFAHAHLANPSHPMAQFLETFHVIQLPTYAAKFPPGQGLALACGLRFGVPIAGVWLSSALACIAVGWMLRAYLSPSWSLLGALLCTVHPLLLWWNNAYWGGSVAMLGGALLLGSAARLVTANPRVLDGVLLGLAVSILAASRPLEGLILSVVIVAPLTLAAIQRIREPAGIRRATAMLLPATGILALTVLLLLHYNARVTGDRLTFPYLAHARQYMVAPLLYHQPLNNPPASPHKVVTDFHTSTELDEFHNARWTNKLSLLITKYLDPVTLIVPLVASLWAAKRLRIVRFGAFLCIAAPLIHMQLTPWLRPAYMSLLIGPLYLLITAGLRELVHRRVFALALFVLISQLVAWVVYIKPAAALAHAPLAVERARLIDRLIKAGGKHLVLVTYGPNHKPTFEFVFNGADVDASPVVFARAMGADRDTPLLDYFRDRRVWDLYFDEGTYRVTPR